MAAVDPIAVSAGIKTAWDADSTLQIPESAPDSARTSQQHLCDVIGAGVATGVNAATGGSGGVPTTRTLTAGAGLTGGGDLTANRTFDVGAGTGIVVNANDVAADFGTGAGKVCQGNDSRLSDDRPASGLRTASTIVSVSAATAPSSGQVLTATGSTAATWQTPASSGAADSYGTLGSRPAASSSNVGTVYYATDTKAAYRCVKTGASTYAWQVIAYDHRIPTDSNDQVVTLFDDAVGTTAPANTGATAGSWTATNTPFTFGKQGPFSACAYCAGNQSGGAWIRGFSSVAPTTLSFSVWVLTADHGGFPRIVHKLYNGSSWSSPFFAAAITMGSTAATCKAEFYQTTGGSNSGAGAHTPPDRTNQQWTLLAWTYDNATSTYTTYVNGGRASQSTSRGAIDYGSSGTRDWAVGNTGISGSSSDPFIGYISDLRIADTLRSQAYYQEMYRRGIGTWEG